MATLDGSASDGRRWSHLYFDSDQQGQFAFCHQLGKMAISRYRGILHFGFLLGMLPCDRHRLHVFERDTRRSPPFDLQHRRCSVALVRDGNGRRHQCGTVLEFAHKGRKDYKLSDQVDPRHAGAHGRFHRELYCYLQHCWSACLGDLP